MNPVQNSRETCNGITRELVSHKKNRLVIWNCNKSNEITCCVVKTLKIGCVALTQPPLWCAWLILVQVMNVRGIIHQFVKSDVSVSLKEDRGRVLYSVDKQIQSLSFIGGWNTGSPYLSGNKHHSGVMVVIRKQNTTGAVYCVRS